jgi:hypothetical protein
MIQRPPHDVWPWLAQMGAGNRAGWHSYDFLDNGRQPTAERIEPELQHLEVGMIFPALPGAQDGFALVAFELDRFLILGWPSQTGEWLVTWTFALEQMDSTTTRLIVRARGGRGYSFRGLPWALAKRIVPWCISSCSANNCSGLQGGRRQEELG